MFATSSIGGHPPVERTLLASSLPRSRASLCAQLAEEFPALDTTTIAEAVDHGVRVAEELCGAAELLIWARAGTLARDQLDLALHRARRVMGLGPAAPMAV
jgi:hypothetical protein